MKHLLLTTIAAVVLVGCKSTSIHKAAGAGNIEAVKHHLATGTDVNAKKKDKFGLTPLHIAAIEGQKEIAELLIAKGADVNAKDDEWGTTPLHAAAPKEIVELLIAKGADVNAMDNDGDTPLDVATHPDNPNASAETADLIRKHGGKTGEELKAAGN